MHNCEHGDFRIMAIQALSQQKTLTLTWIFTEGIIQQVWTFLAYFNKIEILKSNIFIFRETIIEIPIIFQ